MNGIIERKAARFGVVLLALGALTACDDILAVDLPSNLTDDVLTEEEQIKMTVPPDRHIFFARRPLQP